MTALSKRKSKLIFETSDVIRERGRYRPVTIEANPEYAVLRLKGTRKRILMSWAGLYNAAAKVEAARNAAERARRRKERSHGDR